MKKFSSEGNGLWYELRFVYKKIEIIATSGIYQDHKNKIKLNAFLGGAAPPVMAKGNNFILFSPKKAAGAISCIRMLRDYSKQASLWPWCFKSSFFVNKDFHTLSPLRFYESEPIGYLHTCSNLVYTVTFIQTYSK